MESVTIDDPTTILFSIVDHKCTLILQLTHITIHVDFFGCHAVAVQDTHNSNFMTIS